VQPAELVARIRQSPEAVGFDEVMAVISEHYDYQPTRFRNGMPGQPLVNEPGQNEGSCKLFAFARLHGLSEPETLACFGDYYRRDVLGHPDGVDHANIRSFMRHGWAGIEFDGQPLSVKPTT
jgi:hypothetical protein